MSINAVKGVEIGNGFEAVSLKGSENGDDMRMKMISLFFFQITLEVFLEEYPQDKILLYDLLLNQPHL